MFTFQFLNDKIYNHVSTRGERNQIFRTLAKLHGSYKALEGGLTIEAAVDFTGGIPELIDLDRTEYSRERLFYIMTKADSRNAFMGCALTVSVIYVFVFYPT